MKIIYDNIIFSQQRAGGISVVWFEILSRAIQDKDFKLKFIEYKKCYDNIFRKQLTIKLDRIELKSGLFLKVRRYLNPCIRTNERFIFHSSYYRTSSNSYAINITTVHDFTYEKYFSGIFKWLHCKQKYNAILNADCIICISENTKKDLIHYVPKVRVDKIKVVYNGVADDYYPIISKQDKSLELSEVPYVLFVGSRESYKRFDFAIDAIKDTVYRLYVVGGGGFSESEIKLLNSKLGEHRYKHLSFIDNSILNEYYNSAFCLIYPSEYEGFGIPVIEAQKAGCPVIAYNGSSIIEIAEGSALLYKNDSIEEIQHHLKSLNDVTIRTNLIEKGKSNAKRFSWEKTYKAYKNIYTELFLLNK